MSPHAVAAAFNNAQWCDLVCRTHGAVTAFTAGAWVSETRSPPAYPDAVTLHRSVPADEVLTRIDTSAGCSVKDSFASLDLSGYGFQVLFDAEWIHRPADGGGPRPGAALGWRVVEGVDELAAWASAHGGGAVFRPDLLDDPRVAVVFLPGDADGGVAAGAVGNRSGDVVGLSNLFAVSAESDAVWAGASAALSARFPGLPLVGYQRGANLAAAHGAGFGSVGALRVWLKA
jgi:hypothetical protein